MGLNLSKPGSAHWWGDAEAKGSLWGAAPCPLRSSVSRDQDRLTFPFAALVRQRSSGEAAQEEARRVVNVAKTVVAGGTGPALVKTMERYAIPFLVMRSDTEIVVRTESPRRAI
jgi:hypothetical protein